MAPIHHGRLIGAVQTQPFAPLREPADRGQAPLSVDGIGERQRREEASVVQRDARRVALRVKTPQVAILLPREMVHERTVSLELEEDLGEVHLCCVVCAARRSSRRFVEDVSREERLVLTPAEESLCVVCGVW